MMMMVVVVVRMILSWEPKLNFLSSSLVDGRRKGDVMGLKRGQSFFFPLEKIIGCR